MNFEIKEKLSRRDFLVSAGVISVGLGLGGCKVENITTDDQGPPEEVLKNPNNWPVQVVPYGDKVLGLTGIDPFQVPEVGLEQVVLYTSGNHRSLVVSTVWNKNRVSISEVGDRRSYPVGFQPIEENPFVPDVDKLPVGVYVNNEELMSQMSFLNAARRDLYAHLGGLDNKMYLMTVRERPNSVLDHALVFGEGLVNLDGEPSPLSYLALRFRFEPDPKDTI